MKLNLKNSTFTLDEIVNKEFKDKIIDIHEKLHSNDLSFGTEWVKYPVNYKHDDITKLKNIANKIKDSANVLLIIGIGGSYLGAKTGLELLPNDSNVNIEFVGTSFDYDSLYEKLENYKNSEIFINVISKSGTTVEILATLNILEEFMKQKYGKDYNNRIIITTDKDNSYLKDYALLNNIETLSIPTFMGGRYSVLSAVGLLPFAVANIDIQKILDGAKKAYNDLNDNDLSKNIAYKYAIYRYLLYTKSNKKIELFCSFNTKFASMGGWLQQLFCETEGKEGKSLFVSYLTYSTDLHSVGQFIQQGAPIIGETFIDVKKSKHDFILKNIPENNPIKYLENKSMSNINRFAFQGALQAHIDANVPIAILEIDEIDEFNFGYLIYFFEIACATSAFLLQVNPFNQPGVEQYKSHMKNLLLKN